MVVVVGDVLSVVISGVVAAVTYVVRVHSFVVRVVVAGVAAAGVFHQCDPGSSPGMDT